MTTSVPDAPGRPSWASLTARQVRYQLLTMWRTPIALFFTLLLPLVMLIVFGAIFGNETIDAGTEGTWEVSQFYVGGLAAFTAVSATYTNLATMIPIRRDEGVLKRWRGTPLPTSAYVGGFILSALLLAAIGAVMMLGVGTLLYDVSIDAAKIPAALVSFVVGVSAFAALGVAVASLVPTSSSASSIANATLLPLAFVSDIFIQVSDPPAWMEAIGNFFPLRPFASAMQDALNPLVDAPGFDLAGTAYVAAWGVVGLVLAVKFFRWEPHPAGNTRRSRRSRSGTD